MGSVWWVGERLPDKTKKNSSTRAIVMPAQAGIQSPLDTLLEGAFAFSEMTYRCFFEVPKYRTTFSTAHYLSVGCFYQVGRSLPALRSGNPRRRVFVRKAKTRRF